MIHDQALLDLLGGFAVERFDGEVFRATGVNANPLASSVNGGRWAPVARNGYEVPILYTSIERDGALAEVVSYLSLLTPLPSSRPLKISRLAASTSRTFRLARVAFKRLGLDERQYETRNYSRCQAIGAALALRQSDDLCGESRELQ